ncbi:ATP-binding protein [Maridesulfovibrio bastinii]|uniref:ATP-binding protein n=1 Tax=Maridesulfovibrio bastinii TaxID=47157 RepID=UPI00042494AD|nr:ATP-binding protein [Maridesulfovibrio bastinii]
MEELYKDFDKTRMSLSLKADISELHILACRLEEFAQVSGLPEKILFEINLVLDELFTNLVSYGCNGVDEHYFNLKIEYDEVELRLIIEDNGKKFNPLEVPAPDIHCDCQDRKIGGLGVHFMRKLMDSVEYFWENGRNYLKLRKKIPVQ